MNRHTRGPWRCFDTAEFEEGLDISCEARFGMVPVAHVPTGYDEPFESEQRANARLIAASPRMYDFITNLAKQGNVDAAEIIASI